MMTPTALPTAVVISQTEWGRVWVFAHDLASHLAEKGHPVVFFNPFPKRFPRFTEWRRLLGRLLDWPQMTRSAGHPRPAGLRVRTPLTLPDRNRLFTWINRRLLLPRLKRMIPASSVISRGPWVFVFLPFATPVAFAAMLAPSRLVYAQRDGYGDDPRLRHLRNLESDLLRRADLVIASGGVLANKSRAQERQVLDIPGLVDFSVFYRPPTPPAAGVPLCCFFGHVNERVDLSLLVRVAKRFRLRVIGPVQGDWPAGAPGEIMGVVPTERVAELLADCDVVVIPYLLNAFTRNIFPYKIFQAFAQGKPVVVTRLPALEPFSSLLYVAGSAEDFLEQIARAAAEDADRKRERQQVARQHDRQPVLESLRQRLLSADGARPGDRR